MNPDALKQALLQLGQGVASNLDPANQQTPIIGGVRRLMSSTPLGTPDYANPKLTSQQRIADALDKYSQNFMGHGDFGGVPKINTAIKMDKFQGFPDLTSTVLDKLKGVSQIPLANIADLMKNNAVKQGEKDIIGKALEQFKGADKVSANDFAGAVKSQLLPLERKPSSEMDYPDYRSSAARYESVNLPEDQKGPTTNYNENIYQSPVPTSAGAVHFGDESINNYFAHTRTEDVSPDLGNWNNNPNLITDPNTGHLVDKTTGKILTQPDTRRVLEIQSDLFQKGRLDKEVSQTDREELNMARENLTPQQLERTYGKGWAEGVDKRVEEVSKLKPYENTWQDRVIQEEMKKAAQDGIQKLQFPTGDTAMNIEGLSRADTFHPVDVTPDGSFTNYRSHIAIGDIKPGQIITQGDENNSVIITKDLGNGRFRAAPTLTIENEEPLYSKYKDANGEFDSFQHANNPQFLRDIDKHAEQFDISGKVDTNNPIHKFYEGDVKKALTRFSPQMKQVTDPQGVSWYEVPINPQMANQPVHAFGGNIMQQAMQQMKAK